MITNYAIKFGVTRDVSVDIGSGDDEDVVYSVSNASLLEVDVDGIVGVLADVVEKTRAYVYAHDTNGVLRATLKIEVYPSTQDLDDLMNLDGTTKSMTYTFGFPVVFISGDTNAFLFGGYLGGWEGTAAVENYIFATPGTKGTAPANLDPAKFGQTAAGNHERAFVMGGWLNGSSSNGYTDTGEHYLFATPGTKGSSPANLDRNNSFSSMAGNATVAFHFGGYTNSIGAHVEVEQYIFATPGTKGTAPVELDVAKYGTAAASNAYNAFVFGGWTYNTVENYQFAIPGTKGTTPANLDSNRHSPGAASNLDQAFVFGGSYEESSYYGTCEHYVFATPGTKGTTPANLTLNGYGTCAAASRTVALTLGGRDGSSNFVDSVEQYIFATPGTKGTAGAVLGVAKSEMGTAANRTFTIA
jgi:hypothetical protein